MNPVAIIPARIGSTRFPRKALAPILGEPMVCMVRRVVAETGLFARVIVATDDTAILDAVIASGGDAVITSPTHLSGSDRIAEVAMNLDADIIVNVQGDEPLIDKASLQALLDVFEDKNVSMASLMTPFTDPCQLADPNTVKVVVAANSDALYFSRSPLPYYRDDTAQTLYYRHIGVYAYRRETLLRFVALPPGKLELAEKLEQLRALEHGIPIRMVASSYQGIGIDTPQDLTLVESILRQRTQR
jgi:3-deoxy-manno-octulosonate cytidylyltransferase (CMP-KDO synthetase)